MMNTWARLGILGIAVTLMTGCAMFGGPDVESPEVQVIGLAPLDRQGVEQRVRVDLRVRNPNNFPLSFEGVRFKLYVNDKAIGQAISSETIALPRLGETVTSVVATTTLLELMDQAVGIVTDGGAFDYRLSGRLFMRDPFKLSVQFEHQGELPGIRPASVSER